jgi:hypothetical protein
MYMYITLLYAKYYIIFYGSFLYGSIIYVAYRDGNVKDASARTTVTNSKGDVQAALRTWERGV